jgi:hypothetical protein
MQTTMEPARLQLKWLRKIWLPSSSFMFPDAMPEKIGEKRIGAGVLYLVALALWARSHFC